MRFAVHVAQHRARAGDARLRPPHAWSRRGARRAGPANSAGTPRRMPHVERAVTTTTCSSPSSMPRAGRHRGAVAVLTSVGEGDDQRPHVVRGRRPPRSSSRRAGTARPREPPRGRSAPCPRRSRPISANRCATRASRPTPATFTKMRPSSEPRSMRRSTPVMAASNARRGSSGRFSSRASPLPEPAGHHGQHGVGTGQRRRHLVDGAVAAPRHHHAGAASRRRRAPARARGRPASSPPPRPPTRAPGQRPRPARPGRARRRRPRPPPPWG